MCDLYNKREVSYKAVDMLNRINFSQKEGIKEHIEFFE